MGKSWPQRSFFMVLWVSSWCPAVGARGTEGLSKEQGWGEVVLRFFQLPTIQTLPDHKHMSATGQHMARAL